MYIIYRNYKINIIYSIQSKILNIFLVFVLILSLCGLLNQYDLSTNAQDKFSGGVLGVQVNDLLVGLFGVTGSILIMSLISILFIKFFGLSVQTFL